MNMGTLTDATLGNGFIQSLARKPSLRVPMHILVVMLIPFLGVVELIGSSLFYTKPPIYVVPLFFVLSNLVAMWVYHYLWTHGTRRAWQRALLRQYSRPESFKLWDRLLVWFILKGQRLDRWCHDWRTRHVTVLWVSLAILVSGLVAGETYLIVKSES